MDPQLAQGAASSIDNFCSIADLRRLVGELQEALNRRVVTEQAKGVISAKLDVAIDEVFTLLRRFARNSNRKRPLLI